MYTVRTWSGLVMDISMELIELYRKDLVSERFSFALGLERMATEESRCIRTFLRDRGYAGPLDSIRMLEAHGNSHSSHQYLYADVVESKLKWFAVTDWISMHEGMHDVLYVACCNKGNVMLPSCRSALLYPMGEHNSGMLYEEVAAETRTNLVVISSK